jgi:acetoacetate decarboxylase
MLKGFTIPRSPRGTATLTPQPSWHYAVDVLTVEFWSDLDVSAGMLPKGIELGARSGGRSVAFFADCQFTANGDEYRYPRAIRAANSSFFSMQLGKVSRYLVPIRLR